jgi:hypothetical protein
VAGEDIGARGVPLGELAELGEGGGDQRGSEGEEGEELHLGILAAGGSKMGSYVVGYGGGFMDFSSL